MTYYTHDNGRRPFQVVIGEIFGKDEKSVHAFKYIEDDGENTNPNGNYKYSNLACFRCTAKHVMIGESPRNPMTEFSGGHGPRFRGNSILVQDIEGLWTWIGEKIKRFVPLAPIVEFMSPVGNNDVPYPWARDQLGNTYLFIEDVILSPACEWTDNDPYKYYYKHALMTDHEGCIPTQKPLYPYVRNIKFLAVGNEEYAMTYEPLPGKDYDRLLSWNEGGIYVLLHDNTKRPISRDEYIEIMEEVGRERGFSEMKNMTIVNRLW